jgi:hypothetical protein
MMVKLAISFLGFLSGDDVGQVDKIVCLFGIMLVLKSTDQTITGNYAGGHMDTLDSVELLILCKNNAGRQHRNFYFLMMIDQLQGYVYRMQIIILELVLGIR